MEAWWYQKEGKPAGEDTGDVRRGASVWTRADAVAGGNGVMVVRGRNGDRGGRSGNVETGEADAGYKNVVMNDCKVDPCLQPA